MGLCLRYRLFGRMSFCRMQNAKMNNCNMFKIRNVVGEKFGHLLSSYPCQRGTHTRKHTIYKCTIRPNGIRPNVPIVLLEFDPMEFGPTYHSAHRRSAQWLSTQQGKLLCLGMLNQHLNPWEMLIVTQDDIVKINWM